MKRLAHNHPASKQQNRTLAPSPLYYDSGSLPPINWSVASPLTPVSPLLQHDAAPQSSLCGSCDPVVDSAEPSSGFDQRPQTTVFGAS